MKHSVKENLMIYPLIGIPAIEKNPLQPLMQYAYTRCLRRAGASVQFLSRNISSENLAETTDKCAGFLFPGGPDIHPKLYGRLAQPGCSRTDPAQDSFELSLLGAAIKAQKPLFCIGRGMQLLNVAFGGTLLQDIKRRQEYPHYDLLHRAYATHPVDIDPDSLLGQVLKTDTITVNSLHHQAADTIGDGLWISADSPEGFPEALQIEGYPFCLAVQWHPEHMAANTPVQQRLFQAFVEACR